MRKSVIDALFNKTRQEVLAAVLLHPERWWYLSDLAAHIGRTPSSLQKELASLVECDLLTARKDGNRVYYQVNSSCPVLDELQGLFIKTAGVADVVRDALRKHFDRIDAAFIYGSVARGETRSSSDVDVMIIAQIGMMDLMDALEKCEKALLRPVNPTIYPQKEFVQKLRAGNSFLKTVMSGKKIFLKGNLTELEALVGKRADRKGSDER